MRVVMFVGACAAAMALSSRALADDDPNRAAAERLAAIVHDEAESDARVQRAGFVGLLVGGAVALGTGIPLLVDAMSKPAPLSNNDELELIAGAALTAGGGTTILASPLVFLRTRMQRLDSQMRVLSPQSDRLDAEEALLETAAAEERAWRKTNAVLSFVVSGLNAAIVPLDVALGNSGLALLNGTAAFISVVSGTIQLATRGPIERLLRTWRIGTNRGASITWQPVLSPTSFTVRATF